MLLVSNVGFHNKGSELMLVSVVSRARTDLRGYRFCVATDCGKYEQRAALGLYQKLTIGRLGRYKDACDIMVPRCFESRLGIVGRRQISGVLDAGGYCWGDPFPERLMRMNARFFCRWASRGLPVILLPQAFGPFTSSCARRLVGQVIGTARLVYVRDNRSFGFVSDLPEFGPHVKQSPDFTCLTDAVPPSWTLPRKGQFAAIVPSALVARGSSGDCQRAYLRLLEEVHSNINRAGYQTVVLIHETLQDREIAHALGRCAQVEIVEEPDPLAAKGILGQAAFAVSSRFHAIVGALSQGVPCVALGWSHKYGALMKEYGMSEFDIPFERWHEAPDMVHNVARFSVERRRLLRDAGDLVKGKATQMWAEVAAALGGDLHVE